MPGLTDEFTSTDDERFRAALSQVEYTPAHREDFEMLGELTPFAAPQGMTRDFLATYRMSPLYSQHVHSQSGPSGSYDDLADGAPTEGPPALLHMSTVSMAAMQNEDVRTDEHPTFFAAEVHSPARVATSPCEVGHNGCSGCAHVTVVVHVCAEHGVTLNFRTFPSSLSHEDGHRILLEAEHLVFAEIAELSGNHRNGGESEPPA